MAYSLALPRGYNGGGDAAIMDGVGGAEGGVDVRGANGDEALLWASATGRVDVVDWLLTAGANPNACGGSSPGDGSGLGARRGQRGTVAPASTGSSALVRAAENGHADVVVRLLRAGADVHAGDDAALRQACADANVRLVEILLAAGAHVRSERGTALAHACGSGSVAVVDRLLAAGADVHAGNNAALRRACGAGSLAVVERLLAAGADVHAREDDALFMASVEGHANVVARLLEAGADVNALRGAAFERACANGCTAVVEQLVEAGVNLRVCGDRALAGACEHGHAAIVEVLIRAGVNVHHAPENLIRACQNGHLSVVNVLLSNAATTAAAAAAANAHDGLALRCAASGNHWAIVRRLITAGADVHVLDDAALRRASEKGYLRVVEELLMAGANVHALNDNPVASASEHGHVAVTERLLMAGADPRAVAWERLLHPASAVHSLMPAVGKDAFSSLPEAVQVCWLRHNLRLRHRLRRPLDAARAHLHAPPRAPSGKARPTRDELIAELRTAGRAFARDYWQLGAALFGLDREDIGRVFAPEMDQTLGLMDHT